MVLQVPGGQLVRVALVVLEQKMVVALVQEELQAVLRERQAAATTGVREQLRPQVAMQEPVETAVPSWAIDWRMGKRILSSGLVDAGSTFCASGKLKYEPAEAIAFSPILPVCGKIIDQIYALSSATYFPAQLAGDPVPLMRYLGQAQILRVALELGRSRCRVALYVDAPPV